MKISKGYATKMKYRFTLIGKRTYKAIKKSEYFVPVSRYKEHPLITVGWDIYEKELGYLKEKDILVRFIAHSE